ncbi:MAG TPA: hypothetical protein VJ938_10165 [Acidimicrobiia bacterium]|nr:hypothetical protein [Acidimicrobiia bacterium]
MTARELLGRDGFAALMGVRLVDADEGALAVEIDVTPNHMDGAGRVASGVLFSLADCAMSLISNRDRAEVAVATHLTRSGGAEDAAVLRAEISAMSPGGSRATTWHTVVLADDAPVATFTGTTLAVVRRASARS